MDQITWLMTEENFVQWLTEDVLEMAWIIEYNYPVALKIFGLNN